jgi:hypothetical protein
MGQLSEVALSLDQGTIAMDEGDSITTRCGARTRAGEPCRCPILYPNGRCRMHGGPCSRGWIRPEDRARPRTLPRRARLWRCPTLYHHLDPRDPVRRERLTNQGLSRRVVEWRDPVTALPVEPAARGAVRRFFYSCRCGRRVAIVYRHPERDDWACRTCCHFRYASAYHSSKGIGAVCRAIIRAKALDRIIGQGKPKNMSWRLYEEFCQRRDAASKETARAMRRWRRAVRPVIRGTQPIISA